MQTKSANSAVTNKNIVRWGYCCKNILASKFLVDKERCWGSVFSRHTVHNIMKTLVVLHTKSCSAIEQNKQRLQVGYCTLLPLHIAELTRKHCIKSGQQQRQQISVMLLLFDFSIEHGTVILAVTALVVHIAKLGTCCRSQCMWMVSDKWCVHVCGKVVICTSAILLSYCW